MMDSYQGDLADVVRAGGGRKSGSSGAHSAATPPSDGQFLSNPINCYPQDQCHQYHDFAGGNQLTDYWRDPLLNTDHVAPAVAGLLHHYNQSMIIKSHAHGSSSGGLDQSDDHHHVRYKNPSAADLAHKIILDDEMNRPCNMFSRMLQISPNAGTPRHPPAAAEAVRHSAAASQPQDVSTMSLSNDCRLISLDGSKLGCLVESPCLQISSPRNTGIKRRKSQAKKVVCIPAPAPANNRHGGEVVPCDLWAWRKYGQKPIKGSPYPRGYYRCSSSKGCAARKQVERSRTDPSMLVVTYTWEHNHPWPTQRNALAGSTRSSPSQPPIKKNPKINPSNVISQKSATLIPDNHDHREEQKEITGTTTTLPLDDDAAGYYYNLMKLEEADHDNIQLEMLHDDDAIADHHDLEAGFEFDQAEDPWEFNNCFPPGGENKAAALDPFRKFYDWSAAAAAANDNGSATSRQQQYDD